MTIFQAIPFTSEENPNGAPYGDFWEARVDQREGRVYWQTNFKKPEDEQQARHWSNDIHPRAGIYYALAKQWEVFEIAGDKMMVAFAIVQKGLDGAENGKNWYWRILLQPASETEKEV